MRGFAGELIDAVADVHRDLATFIAWMARHIAELALVLHPMDGTVVMFVRSGDPHVVVLTIDPETGMADGPVIRVDVVRVGEEKRAAIPETPRVAGEVVEIVVTERRGCNIARRNLRTGLLELRNRDGVARFGQRLDGSARAGVL